MRSIGVEWVNEYHGNQDNLHFCDNNGEQFTETLHGESRFTWGNDWAWDIDFQEPGTDSIWADDVDIIFFSGHGCNGADSIPYFTFGVMDHDSGYAYPSTVRLGNKTAKWAVLDACNCLLASLITEWLQIFLGLHYILGFASDAIDSAFRGKYFARRLNRGHTIRDAWRRACKLTEADWHLLSYLRADNQGSDTWSDHWIDEGYVSPNPTSPVYFYYYRENC